MRVSLDLPFVDKHPELLECLIAAHQQAAQHTSNASSTIAVVATQGSHDFSKGVIAATASIGGSHAPLAQARQVYRYATKEWVESQKIVPGFGNSFYKDKVDPAFEQVLDMLAADFPEADKRIHELHCWVKKVHPNAALITAAVCEVCGIPDGLESALFIISRVPVWASQVVSK
jgi:citrate synthase